MKYFIRFFQGIMIGAGAILPGISSGVLCVIFGIYEKLVTSILSLFKNFKENFSFLFPIALGGIIGIILFGNLLNYLFTFYPIPMNYAFTGFILGCIPFLAKKVIRNENFHFSYFIYFFISFLLGILLIYLENHLPHLSTVENISWLYLALAGFFMSIGIVVPGISSSVILMCMQIYPTYLSAVSSVSLPILIPLGIGVILGSICWLKLISYLLSHYACQTYCCIIGFVIGSVFILFPGFAFHPSYIFSILLMLACFFTAKKLG